MGSGAGGLQDIYEGVESGIKNALTKYDKRFALRQMDPLEIQFPARGLTSERRAAFANELAIQEKELNRMSLFETEAHQANLDRFHSPIPGEKKFTHDYNNTARRKARERLNGAGTGLDAAHNLDAVAGGHIHNITGLRNPVQQRVGSLWRDRWQQIQPGRRHKLTPIFED